MYSHQSSSMPEQLFVLAWSCRYAIASTDCHSCRGFQDPRASFHSSLEVEQQVGLASPCPRPVQLI
eukprot:15185023-Heterocapsa_arctica.AAC.1